MAQPHNPTEISNRDEVAYLNALDPHATTTTKPWELELDSQFLRKVAIAWIVVVMAVHVFMAWAVDAEFTGVAITGLDKFAFIGVGLVAVGGYAVYQVSSKIQERVSNFIDPFADFDGIGNQPANALIGLSWGGITGTGLGYGHPELVPVAHSDYILAAVGEELGFVGIAAVLCLFGVFITRGFRTAMQARDSYGKLLASGLALTIAIQIFVVAGGVSAMLPMTGLTTPFMSAGGSSVMANYILLGLLLRISNSANRPPEYDEATQRREVVGAR